MATGCLLLVSTTAAFGLLVNAHAPEKRAAVILGKHEGDVVGSHYIKADPKTGSMRIGVGLQRLKAGQGVSIHMHEKEDEILFIHSGSGIGAAGGERKTIGPGTTIYIPQGAWHGIQSHSDMEILWVASPPHFAANLRDLASKLSSGDEVPSRDVDEIGRLHGFRDSDGFFVPRLVIVSSALAIAAGFLGFFIQSHLFRAMGVYTLGGMLGSIVTLFAVGPGYLPAVVFGLGIVSNLTAVVIGSLLGSLARRLVARVSG